MYNLARWKDWQKIRLHCKWQQAMQLLQDLTKKIKHNKT